MTFRTATLALTTLCCLVLMSQAAAQTRIVVGQQAPDFALESSAGITTPELPPLRLTTMSTFVPSVAS